MRRNFYTGKYKLSKAEYLSAKYYAMRYTQWLDEYNSLKDAVTAITIDGLPHGTNTDSSTERLAIQRDKLSRKMKIIEGAAKEADPELWSFLLKKATSDITYEQLNMSGGLWCSRRTFYRKLHKFYYILAKRI